MSWKDRDYNREEASMFGGSSPRYGGGGGVGGGFGSRFGSRLRGGSVVTWLLVINVVVFLIDSVLSGSARGDALSLTRWGNFNVAQAVYGLQIWRFVSYEFLHLNFFHILFNMIALYFFGPLLEQWWGSRRFLAFYILCGVGGAVLMLLLSFVPGLLGVTPQTPMVGASGSIFGILVGAAVLFPRMRVMLLLPPVPMSMRTLALIFLGIAVLSILVGARNAGGEAAHLGGALVGFILVKTPILLDWADRMSPSAIQNNVNKGRFERKQKQQHARQQEIDRILDKVRQNGLGSLTKREKKTLQQATDEMKK